MYAMNDSQWDRLHFLGLESCVDLLLYWFHFLKEPLITDEMLAIILDSDPDEMIKHLGETEVDILTTIYLVLDLLRHVSS
jgi:hypothetical protein